MQKEDESYQNSLHCKISQTIDCQPQILGVSEKLGMCYYPGSNELPI
jgi:hypothetical protein